MAGREGLLSRRTRQAMISPSALLLLGAGVAVGLALGLPVLAAIGLGLLAWVVRVGFTAFERPATPRVKVSSLREPWRGFVLDVQAAKDRYRRAVATMDDGSLRDHLGVVGQRIDRSVDEAQQIARRGQQIDEALASIDVAACRRSWTSCAAPARRVSPPTAPPKRSAPSWTRRPGWKPSSARRRTSCG